MGANNFFAKLAGHDPLAQALNLPGATKHQDWVISRNAPTTPTPAYAGLTPTLAGANSGYAAPTYSASVWSSMSY